MDHVIAVEGLSTKLPCDVTPPKQGEQVYLVLWYRQDDGGEPIYRWVYLMKFRFQNMNFWYLGIFDLYFKKVPNI